MSLVRNAQLAQLEAADVHASQSSQSPSARRPAAKDDPLVQMVLNAPPLQRELTEEERAALDEYLRAKGASRTR